MRKASELLSGMKLQKATGEAVPVEQLWADRPVVVGFVRHFG